MLEPLITAITEVFLSSLSDCILQNSTHCLIKTEYVSFDFPFRFLSTFHLEVKCNFLSFFCFIFHQKNTVASAYPTGCRWTTHVFTLLHLQQLQRGWNAGREECKKKADLVVIDSKEKQVRYKQSSSYYNFSNSVSEID